MGAGSQLDFVRMLVQHALNRIAEVESAADGFRSFVVSWDPESKKRNMHPAFAQASKINHSIQQAIA